MLERQRISTAQSYKSEEENHAKSNSWKDELRAHPELILYDDFWKTHQDPSRTAYRGLFWLLGARTCSIRRDTKPPPPKI